MKRLLAMLIVLAVPAAARAEDYASWAAHHDLASPVWVLPKVTAPENMRWTTPTMQGEIDIGRFFAPTTCKGCHPVVYDAWKGSMMANAWNDPVFIAVYKSYLARVATEAEKSEIAMCSRCHTPPGYAGGNLGRYFQGELGKVEKAGVSCDVCHSVEASAGIGNAAWILHPKDPSVEGGGTKYGPRKDSVSDFHLTQYSELHTRADFCGQCHDVAHAHNMMPIEATYTEWRTGPYNTGNPSTSTHCQDCHMRQTPSVAATGTTELPNSPGYAAPESFGGKQREHVWQHYFIGGNFVVTTLLGFEQSAKMAQDRLANALTVEVINQGKALLKGAANTMQVKVINSGAGHYLPTGLTYVREMWINLRVKDADGKILYESGALDAEGNLDPNAAVYKTILGEGGQERKPTFFLPAALQVLEDKRIRPKGFSLEKYAFLVPAGFKGPAKVEVEVKYRSAPQFLINEVLGKEAPKIPVYTMGGRRSSSRSSRH